MPCRDPDASAQYAAVECRLRLELDQRARAYHEALSKSKNEARLADLAALKRFADLVIHGIDPPGRDHD